MYKKTDPLLLKYKKFTNAGAMHKAGVPCTK